ncbi:hypothetical protein [Robiginitomaculum antarcticum]|uniref:hypothetical protein n=1 Tax=Robiginitomaculum antarcticum TaxID=437507 RepID=UPI0003A3342B|nr:hypothetical protein [Robiginitomaculum antarcticum]
MTKTDPISDKPASRLSQIEAAANAYGLRSLDNYVQIRSVAERLRDGLCAFLDDSRECVFLVPPQGGFSRKNYGSAAFSVSGKGVLPLEPISFGLAVRVTESDDYMRLVMTARKAGDRIYIRAENKLTAELNLPLKDENMMPVFESLTDYLLNWFQSRIDHYDDGDYGGTDIGFDILRVETTETPVPTLT